MRLTTMRRFRAVGLALIAAVLLAGAIASAQDAREVHRFFGFLGDVTINGEPIDYAAEIVAMKGEEEIGRTVIGPAGTWVIDVDVEHIESRPCPVSFVVDGIRADPEWTHCPFRVQLALTGPVEEPSVAEVEELEEDKQEDVMEEVDEDDAVSDEEDEMQEAVSEDEDVATAEQVETTPGAPRTGTGGLLGNQEETTNWPQAAALTAALMLVISAAAWLMSRRSDGAH